MPAETLDLLLPDWGRLDDILRSPLPFALWTIGDQCLLHHWLDHAVNLGVGTLRVFASDRPLAVKRILDESALWPIRIEFTAINTPDEAPAGATAAGWFPGEDPPAPPADGWDLIGRAAAIERIWLERMGGDKDFSLYSTGFSCRIHPTAKLVSPYFIGDHVLVGPDCEIGPHAVIGQGSVVAGGNIVADSHVSAHSFVGPMTALENCRLDNGTLFSLKNRVSLEGIEPHLLSSLVKSGVTVPAGDRVRALLLYLRLGAPLAPRNRTFSTFDGRELPGSPDADLATRIMWLPLVWKGRLPLYGVLPRTKEQLETLPMNWQNVLRHAPAGVFSYADCLGVHSAADPAEAAHAVYQASLPVEALAASLVEFTRNLKATDLRENP